MFDLVHVKARLATGIEVLVRDGGIAAVAMWERMHPEHRQTGRLQGRRGGLNGRDRVVPTVL